MAKEVSIKYVCSACGREEIKWMGKCPSCGAWNSFEEEKVIPQKKTKGQENLTILDTAIKKLSDVKLDESIRFNSGLSELDRVLGGGIMKPSSVLVGGEPGIGKSTIMLQLLSSVSKEKRTLYISGEESPSQIKLRAERINANIKDISVLGDTRVEAIIKAIEDTKPEVVVVDSIQTLSTSTVDSSPGSPNQMKNCCLALSLIAKSNNIAMFFVGHVTKDGLLAGPKVVEHMVDTVLYFEHAETGVRFLRATKNRFGSVDEIGIFQMDEKGLLAVKDPAGFFISSRPKGELPPGISYTSVIEGTRTFLVELQALVVPAKSGFSRVFANGVESARVSRVAAIIERHVGIRLSDQDIYINVAGGMKLNEVSVDLALALALFSAKENRPLPEKMVSFGELSLAGEVRPVAHLDKRLKASSDMGYDSFLIPYAEKQVMKTATAVCRTIKQAIGVLSTLRKED